MNRLFAVSLLFLLFSVGTQAQEIFLTDVEYVGFWVPQRVNGNTVWALLVKVDGENLPILVKKQDNAWDYHDSLSSGDRLDITGVLSLFRYRHHINNDVRKIWVVERGETKNWIRKR